MALDLKGERGFSTDYQNPDSNHFTFDFKTEDFSPENIQSFETYLKFAINRITKKHNTISLTNTDGRIHVELIMPH